MLSTKNLALEVRFGFRKLNPQFYRPFVVMEKINDVTFKLELSDTVKHRGQHDSFHVSRLEPYEEDPFSRDRESEPVVIFEDGSQKMEVEQILSHRKRRRKVE